MDIIFSDGRHCERFATKAILIPTIFIHTFRRSGKFNYSMYQNNLKLSEYLPNKQISRYKDGRHVENDI